MVAAVLKAKPVDKSRLAVQLQPGECVEFEGVGVTVEFAGKSGKAAKLSITAPRALKIVRKAGTAPDTSMAG